MKPHHYRIPVTPTPETVKMFGVHVVTNGVYVTDHGAWLGQVYVEKEGGRTTGVSVMPHLHRDKDGEYVPAPENWRERIIEELPGIIE